MPSENESPLFCFLKKKPPKEYIPFRQSIQGEIERYGTIDAVRRFLLPKVPEQPLRLSIIAELRSIEKEKVENANTD